MPELPDLTGPDLRRDLLWIQSMLEESRPDCRAEVLRHRADTAYLVLMGGRILAMQTGFALLESAFVRKMNTANIMMKNLMDLLLGSIIFYVVGIYISFGLVPNLFEEKPFDYAFWFLQLTYATTAATITSGAVAGRVAYHSYLMLSVCLTGIIYPTAVWWTWGGGWLQQLGYRDFAGGSVVHLVGAISALVSVCFAGPRIGRFASYQPWSGIWRWIFREHNEAKYYEAPTRPREKAIWSPIPEVTNPVQCLFATFCLLMGFMAFNPAATYETTVGVDRLDARTTVTTLLTVSGAPLGCWVVSFVKRRTAVITVPDLAIAMVSCMVSSSACCNVVPPLMCILVGFVGTVLSLVTRTLLLNRKIDDVVSALASHGPSGAWGVVSVAIWARPHCSSDLKGIWYGGGDEAWKLLGIQIVGLIALAAFSAVSTWVVVVIIDHLFGWRCGRACELIGLDFMEHEYYSGKPLADPDKAQLISESSARDCLMHRLKTRPLGASRSSLTLFAPRTTPKLMLAMAEEPKVREEDPEISKGIGFHKEEGSPKAPPPSAGPESEDVVQTPLLTNGQEDLLKKINRLRAALSVLANQMEELQVPQGNPMLLSSARAPEGQRILALQMLMQQARAMAHAAGTGHADFGNILRKDSTEMFSITRRISRHSNDVTCMPWGHAGGERRLSWRGDNNSVDGLPVRRLSSESMQGVLPCAAQEGRRFSKGLASWLPVVPSVGHSASAAASDEGRRASAAQSAGSGSGDDGDGDGWQPACAALGRLVCPTWLGRGGGPHGSVLP